MAPTPNNVGEVSSNVLGTQQTPEEQQEELTFIQELNSAKVFPKVVYVSDRIFFRFHNLDYKKPYFHFQGVVVGRKGLEEEVEHELNKVFDHE